MLAIVPRKELVILTKVIKGIMENYKITKGSHPPPKNIRGQNEE